MKQEDARPFLTDKQLQAAVRLGTGEVTRAFYERDSMRIITEKGAEYYEWRHGGWYQPFDLSDTQPLLPRSRTKP